MIATGTAISAAFAGDVVHQAWDDIDVTALGARVGRGIWQWEQDTVREALDATGTYIVRCAEPQKTRPGEATQYRVSLTWKTCECADSTFRRGRVGYSICKHLIAVALYAGLGRPWLSPLARAAQATAAEVDAAYFEALAGEPPDDIDDLIAADAVGPTHCTSCCQPFSDLLAAWWTPMQGGEQYALCEDCWRTEGWPERCEAAAEAVDRLAVQF